MKSAILLRYLTTLATICTLTAATIQAADVFERHTGPIIRKSFEDLDATKAVAQITLNESARLKPLSATIGSPCIFIKTDEENWSKAIVTWGLRKTADKPVQVLLIERYVTYRGDRPELTTAVGKDVMVFPGFAFNFDIGQVVPAGQGGDIEFTADGALKVLEPARMIPLNGSQLPPVDKATGKPADHEGVEAGDFAGTWKVDADGRWTGEWRLKIAENGRATGSFVSKDLQNTYDITGQISGTPHNLKLDVFLANAQMQVDAYLWTTDKSKMAGTVTLTGRKFGFLATRVEEPE